MPVLLGSLARIPMGLLTDRYRGRAVFTALMLVRGRPAVTCAVGSAVTPNCWRSHSCSAWPDRRSRSGSASFRAGSRPDQQGSALGVYGLGNIGQSAAVFLGPVLAASIGMDNVFHGMSAVLRRLGRRVLR